MIYRHALDYKRFSFLVGKQVEQIIYHITDELMYDGSSAINMQVRLILRQLEI